MDTCGRKYTDTNMDYSNFGIRGNYMKYEKPNMEILLLDVIDIVTLSSETSGDGDGYTGGWNS